MTTIINNDKPPVERTTLVERDTDSSAGWGVAVIILLIVIAVGAYFWIRHRQTTQPSSGANINITVPSGSSGSSGGTTGGGNGY